MSEAPIPTTSDSTPQQVFDAVRDHLLRQGRRSMTPDGGCMYRAPDGCMCAIGPLLSDDEAHQWETKSASSLTVSGPLFHLRDMANLLDSLQRVHDQRTPEDWPNQLRHVAQRYGLTA